MGELGVGGEGGEGNAKLESMPRGSCELDWPKDSAGNGEPGI